MEFWARWKWISGGGVDGAKVGIEKPLSFCLVKLYILTRDAPTPSLRSWNKREQSQVLLPGEYISEVLFSFFSDWRKASGTLPMKLELRTFLYDICHLWYLKQRVEQRTYSFDSFNHLSITLIVWFTGLIKKGTFQLNVVVLLLNLVSQCLTIESHCC